MNQKREEDEDQGDYEEPGEDGVANQVEMMWQTNENYFKEATNEVSEPQVEDQNMERDSGVCWKTKEHQKWDIQKL